MIEAKHIIILLFLLPIIVKSQVTRNLDPALKETYKIKPLVKRAGTPDSILYKGPMLLRPMNNYYQYSDHLEKWVERKIQQPDTLMLSAPDTINYDRKSTKIIFETKSLTRKNWNKSDVHFAQSVVNEAIPPRYKDNAVIDVKYYDIVHGLSNSYIYDIYKAPSGLLWIATNGGGVCRFDGEQFEVFKKSNGLAHNMVKAIAPDTSGGIWFATMEGATYYNQKTFISITKDNGLSNNTINDVLVDAKNRVWLATDGGGINMIENGKLRIYGASSGFPAHITTLYQDNKKRIWFGTLNKGVYVLHNNILLHYNTHKGLNSNSIRDISGYQSKLFIAHDEGLDILDGDTLIHYGQQQGLPKGETNVVYSDSISGILLGMNGGGLCRIKSGTISCIDSRQGLNSDEIYAIQRDRSNVFWIGTWGGGLNRYDGFTFIHYTKDQGLPANVIPAMAQDEQKNLWLGTFGKGFFKFKSPWFLSYQHEQGFSGKTVWSMLFDAQNKLWLATRGSGLWGFDGQQFTVFNATNGFPSNSIWSLHEDQSGNLWIGTSNKGILKYNGDTFQRIAITDQIVLSIFEDSKGNLWVSTWGDGVYKISDDRFTHFNPDNNFPADKVYNIYEDRKGYIWFATSGEGVLVYNGKNIESFGQADGLTSNIIYWIKKISEQRILMGSESGLNELVIEHKTTSNYPDSGFVNVYLDTTNQQKVIEIDGRHYAIHTYGINEGFTGHDCIGSQNSALKTRRGSIWIGTGNQLTNYNPGYELPDTLPPTVHLKSVDLFLQSIDWHEKYQQIKNNRNKRSKIYFDSLNYRYKIPLGLNLPYYKNHISFNFVGINWKSPQKILYQYRLKGYEDDWNYPTARSHATYANLPPGAFTFEIRAMNSDHYWSEPLQYPFTIRTPWWQTWWFQVSVFFVVVLFVVAVIRLRVRSLRQQKATLETMVKERTQEILQQKEEIQTQRDNLNHINTKLERLSIVARETHNGVLIADNHGQIEWINEGYTNLLGFTLSSLKDQKGINLFFIYKNDNTLEYIKKCRDQKQPVTFTSLFEKKNKEKIWLQTTVTPILDELGEIKKYVVIYADVTTLKMAQAQIEQHNQEITSSIRYASRIQASVLPLKQHIAKSELDTFILYRPKDIVGGDFYWFSRHGLNYLAGVIDCTGHGVPGAFMTVIAYAVLSRIINDETASNPALLLNTMNKHVRSMLKQHTAENGHSDDGLDASFCLIKPREQTVIFSGAKQALFHTWSGEIAEVKGDRQSIGYASSDESFEYTNHFIDIQHNSVFYLASDGFKDMSIDGEGHILGKKQFRQLLSSLGGKSMQEQHQYLTQIMDKSLDQNEQHDDITIFAFKLPDK